MPPDLHTRLLFRLGRAAARRPRLAATSLEALRRVPTNRLRKRVATHVSTPIVQGMEGCLVVSVAGGGRLEVDATDVTGRMLAVSGIWEPHVTAVVRSTVWCGDVVADVGANIGYFTILAARLVGTNGHVYAIEPSPGTYATLVGNVRRNDLGNVTTIQAAAGPETGEAMLRDVVEGSNRGASSLRSDPERGWGVQRAVSVVVAVRPLADIIPSADWARLRLIKIDVEGFEAEVLRGLEPVYESGHRPSIVVEVHTDIDMDAAASVVAFAARYGLLIRRIVDRPDDDRIFAASHPVLEAVDGAAVIASPDARIDLLLSA